MSESSEGIREIRINPIVPSESVLVSTARGLRPRKEEAPVERDTREHVDTCPYKYVKIDITLLKILKYTVVESV